MSQKVADKVYTSAVHPDVLRNIPDHVRSLLDVGCGNGAVAELLGARGVDIDGITLSPSEATAAARHCRRVVVYNLEEGLPPVLGGQYDCALCSHVLEHICYPDRLLSDLRTRIRAGGYLLVALPNMLYIRERLKLLVGIVDYRKCGLLDETHFRWYTRRSARKLLISHGFVIEKAFVSASIPMMVFRKMIPASICGRLERLAGRLLPGLFGWQMIFLCRNP